MPRTGGLRRTVMHYIIVLPTMEFLPDLVGCPPFLTGISKLLGFVSDYDRTAKPFAWTYSGGPLKVA